MISILICLDTCYKDHQGEPDKLTVLYIYHIETDGFIFNEALHDNFEINSF
jgi:hypothetical protein